MDQPQTERAPDDPNARAVVETINRLRPLLVEQENGASLAELQPARREAVLRQIPQELRAFVDVADVVLRAERGAPAGPEHTGRPSASAPSSELGDSQRQELRRLERQHGGLDRVPEGWFRKLGLTLDQAKAMRAAEKLQAEPAAATVPETTPAAPPSPVPVPKAPVPRGPIGTAELDPGVKEALALHPKAEPVAPPPGYCLWCCDSNSHHRRGECSNCRGRAEGPACGEHIARGKEQQARTGYNPVAANARRSPEEQLEDLVRKMLRMEKARRIARDYLDRGEHAAGPVAEQKVEDLTAFMGRLRDTPPLGWLVRGLIPEEGICLWHAQPREMKSLCALEAALALASGRPPFGDARFAVPRAVKVAYFTEEDSERLFHARLRWLTAKLGAPAPGMFFPFVRRRLSFDSPGDREEIIRLIGECGAQCSTFDPLRSFTVHADQGPSDLAPVARFLRRIQNETASKAVKLLHHDTKPLPTTAAAAPGKGGDPLAAARTRSQQASGGGIFSISDCPVAFRKLDWNKVAVFPEDYKMSGDPSPFVVTFATDEVRDAEGRPHFGTWVVPEAETREAPAIVAGAVREKVAKFLKEHADSWHTTAEVEEGAPAKNHAKAALEALRVEGLVLFATGKEAAALDHNQNAKLWRWAGKPVQVALPDSDDGDM